MGRRCDRLVEGWMSNVEACCSWCTKGASEVEVMIEGRGCYICDECVDLCVEIVRKEKDRRRAGLGTATKRWGRVQGRTT
jgi:dissimilatory sulfite reductase (desulfoviridin) alpha/beta subunit